MTETIKEYGQKIKEYVAQIDWDAHLENIKSLSKQAQAKFAEIDWQGISDSVRTNLSVFLERSHDFVQNNILKSSIFNLI